MSFEIILTRTTVPGINKKLDDPEAQPLTAGDFELIMDGAPIRRRLEDGTCWLWHPDGMAWLAASFHPNNGDGYITFAVSYAHNQFMKIWADAIDLGLRMGRSLSARVFEDSEFQEITRENADELMSPDGNFVAGQGEMWKQTVYGMEENVQAPLEYPVDRYDGVNDYFVFFLDAKERVDMRELVNKLKLSYAPDSLTANSFALQDAESGNVLTRVVLRPNDGAIQIRPFYWMEPFSRVAAETLNLAVQFQEELGGRLFLKEKLVDHQLRDEIKSNISGLGVEFFLWLQSRS
jgi:hypothetical protein